MHISRIIVFLAASILASAQNSSSPAAPAADYSRESYVIESLVTRMTFENDGTGTKSVTARIRLQDAGAVQQFGQLREGYNSANEKLDIPFARVHKPDGTVVSTPPASIQDVSAPVERIAPVYSDYRERHITVAGLAAGDTLEWQTVVTTVTPLATGQFWTTYDFAGPGGPIVLSEQLEISVPKDRKINLKNGSSFAPKISEEGSRRMYRWNSSHLRRESDDELKKLIASRSDFSDVQMTTFDSWDQVGAWYAALSKDRRQPTARIKEKAAALVANRTSELEKTKALYDFVAHNFRYVSLSFGTGRYQPHFAEDVLGNEYGDCKDKDTLLAALLSAVGIPSSSALMNSARRVDPDVPSPAQFDHVVTVAQVEGQPVWMDTTAELAPFRLILPVLRDKKALLIPPDSAAHLATSPADAPFTQVETVDIEGKVDAIGKLDAKVSQVIRGDSEVPLRLVFRQVKASDYSKVLEYGLNQQGVSGSVSSADIGDPTATDAPLKMSFTLEVPNFLDWTKKKTVLDVPLTRIPLSALDEDSTEPILLGGAAEFSAHSHIELPPTSTVRLPLPVSVSRDYATYTSEYKLDGNAVVVDRKLVFKSRELARSHAADYNAFRHALEQDQDQKVSVENTVASGSVKVPESAKAEELVTAGLRAYDNGQFTTSIDILKRAVEIDPRNKYAWNNLGRAYMATGKLDEAVDAFHKQIDINPYDEWSYNNLGLALTRQKKTDDAIKAFQKQIEVNPLDKYAHKNLGRAYSEQKNYTGAADEFARAAQITPEDANLLVELGHAYLQVGKNDDALAVFDRAVRIAPAPPTWNNIAYYLAQQKVALDRAEQYAESSVASTEALLRNLTPETMDGPQASLTSFLASAWDTLGWVKFQRGDIDGAEKWIKSSWVLAQRGEVGDHLAQIYEKRGDKQAAKIMYAKALASPQPQQESRARLAALIGGDKSVDAAINKARSELSTDRTLKLGKTALNGTAEFNILLSPGPTVEAVKFVSGDEKLKPFADKLRALKFDVSFPDSAPTRVAFRGFLDCSSLTHECMFVRGTDAPTAAMNRVVPSALRQ